MTELSKEQIGTSPAMSAEEVISKYYNELEPLLRRTINSRFPNVEGDDVTQEVAIALFRAVNSGVLLYEAAIPNWTFTVGLRFASRISRGERMRDALPIDDVDKLPESMIDQETPEHQIDINFRNQSLHGVLESINPRDADVLRSLFLRDESYGQVAERWSTDTDTIGPWRTRSLRRAQKAFLKQGINKEDII